MANSRESASTEKGVTVSPSHRVLHAPPSGSETARYSAASGAASAAALRARDSRASALVVIAVAYAVTVGMLVGGEIRGVSTWYAPEGASRLTLAGRWYVFVSLPLFNFILFRWVHRLVVWGRFLRRVARLELQLTAAHPDRAGGLGFLGTSCLSLAPLLIAANAVLARETGMDFIAVLRSGSGWRADKRARIRKRTKPPAQASGLAEPSNRGSPRSEAPTASPRGTATALTRAPRRNLRSSTWRRTGASPRTAARRCRARQAPARSRPLRQPR